ncbi:SIMPL domain-containing protein [Teredinibacter turnerae]|uniref:SIMPL domain-containing protein n=1 Tax=Teredinibacter turnerae TaxID=2426 RepID=UPI00037B47D2|nr:SIMPL domain-containing protein [Teredinibacter turnerae]
MKYIFCLISILFSVGTFADSRIVAIKGYGVVEVEADIIDIGFEVANTDYKDLESAKKDVEKRSYKIVKSIVKLGISEEDISSPHYYVDTEKGYRDRECPEFWKPSVVRGIEVRIKDISKYGAVLDTIVSNGVSRIDSVEPNILDTSKLERKAMLIAIEDSKEQARFLAESYGTKIGKIHSIGERKYRNNFGIEEVVVTGMRASAPERDDIPYQFKPGKVEVEADIYVEFELE